MGIAAVFFGIIGIIGGAIVSKNNKIGGIRMVLSGILGFIAISLFWIIPGVLLVIGGVLVLKNKIIFGFLKSAKCAGRDSNPGQGLGKPLC